MYISSVEIINYKSYLAPGVLELRPGFNVVTSQNNTGKTALLEALQMLFEDAPHRSPQNVHSNGSFVQVDSFVDINITIPPSEMLMWLDMTRPIHVPQYDPSIETVINPKEHTSNEDIIKTFNDWLLKQEVYTIKVRVVNRNFSSNFRVIKDWYDIYPKNQNQSFRISLCLGSQDHAIHLAPNTQDMNEQIGSVGNKVFTHLKSSLFSFRAERYNHGQCPVGSSTILAPDTINLAEVLNQLQANRPKYAQYVEKVRQILPNIHDVTVKSISNSQFQIITWNDNLARDEFAVPLKDCGTGVGQVLAILYVVLNAKSPQTIIIDEPNSFLHPGAVRKLIDVLQEHPQHQYILTTHSSTVITASKPSTLTMIRKKGAESYFEVIDPNQNDQARVYLSELGALADVFGADNILWVEGETEQECFPFLVKKLLGRPILGTVISKVLHTGDFDKNPMLAFEVYTQISKRTSLIPPTIGFIFDREERPPAKIEEWEAESKGLVRFLPRRLYENYLLDAEAITAIINECDTNRSNTLTSKTVQEWMDKEVDAWIEEGELLKRTGRKANIQPLITEKKDRYGKPPSNREDWKVVIHGARLLEHLFEYYCEQRLSYKKTDHSMRLTLWLIDHKHEELDDIVRLLREAFNRLEATLSE